MRKGQSSIWFEQILDDFQFPSVTKWESPIGQSTVWNQELSELSMQGKHCFKTPLRAMLHSALFEYIINFTSQNVMLVIVFKLEFHESQWTFELKST